jgi:GDP-L-fucose synthase
MINKNSKIYVAGHTGLVGSSVIKVLKARGFKKIFFKKSSELDLRNQQNVFRYLKKIKPDGVIICAAKVGGIKANNELRGEFIYENLSIQNNLIHGSFLAGVKNLIFLGSSCIYPRLAKQPIKESCLLAGELEPTNLPYAVAKIAGVKLCESYNYQYKTNYKCLMPSNIFGPNDNYNLNTSHFFPAIIKKLHLSKLKKKKSVLFWGTGKVMRELTFSEDLADACIFFLKKKTKEALINIGSGFEYSIRGYIRFVRKHMGLKSQIIFDGNKKIDGAPRKLVDCKLAKKYGWNSKFTFLEAFSITYRDFLMNQKRYLNM